MKKLIVFLAGLVLVSVSYGQTVSVVAETGAFTNVPTVARVEALEDGTTLPALASGKIIVGNSGGTGTAVTVTGDVTLSNAGVAGIAAGVIVNADIATNAAIAGTKLAQAVQDSLALADSSLQAEVDPVVSAIVGIVMSDGTNIAAAAAGTDYLAPDGDGSGLSGVVTAEVDSVVAAINGIVLSDGTNIAAAVAGTDYQAPLVAGTDYLAPDGNLTGSLGTSTTAVDTIVSGAAAGATAAQPSDVAGAPSVAGSVATLTNTVTITAKDSGGTTLAERRLVRVWMAETAYGVPSTNNIESLTLSGGTAIQTVTAAADYVYLTAATGIASAEVVGTAAGTNYVMVADGGYVTSAAVVFE